MMAADGIDPGNSRIVMLFRSGVVSLPLSIAVAGTAYQDDTAGTTHHGDVSAAAGGTGGVAKMKKIEPRAARAATTVKPY